MKVIKNVLMNYSLFVLFTIAISFTACSSNDDNDSEQLSNELVGTYTGKVMTESTDGEVAATMKVTATGDNSVKIEFISGQPAGTAQSVTTDLRVGDSNSIIGTEAAIVNLIYYKGSKSLICQHTGGSVRYSFTGTKQ